ncbi:MAG: sigma-70 family RNA polymerase sigma factor [Clostridiales bacterium]|nr:sigma-70 family RNA polymerase sigma factor [Clostridiales bacterium]
MFTASARDADTERVMRRIVSQYAASIIRLAFGYVKNRSDAEDLAQEVFLVLLRKKPVFADERAEQAWLMRVTANKCKVFLKSAWRKHTQPLTEELTFLPAEEGYVMSVLLELEEKYRIPVWLFYFYGFSIKEIAHCLKIKPATAATWLHRGRARLREKLGDDFDV